MPSRLKPAKASVLAQRGREVRFELTVRHVNDEFASIALSPTPDDIVDRVVPGISECRSGDLANLHPPSNGICSGIPELDHHKVGPRSHALVDSASDTED